MSNETIKMIAKTSLPFLAWIVLTATGLVVVLAEVQDTSSGVTETPIIISPPENIQIDEDGGNKQPHSCGHQPEPLYAKEVYELEHYLVSMLDGTTDGLNEVNQTRVTDFSVFQQVFKGFSEVIKVRATCFACEVYLALLIHQIKMGTSQERLEEMTYVTCKSFNISTDEVCRGVITRLAPSFYFIIKNRPQITPKMFCGLTFQNIGCSHNNDPYLEFTVDVDDKKRDIFRHDYEPLTILHYTDVHMDLDYVTNSSAVCDEEVLCCHGNVTNNSSEQAGEFGDSRSCDAPIPLVINSLDFSRNLNVDVMYMTGDIVPHNIWYSTRELNTEAIQVFGHYLDTYYSNRKIVFCIGNHEPHPVNLYTPDNPEIPEELKTNWIFDVTYEAMKNFIPESFKNNGNYVVHYNKLKVIVINTNVCYTFNFWQLYEPNDPMDVLKFLNKNLKEAEVEKYYVHIVGHVPPGHEDCNNIWSREFHRIVNRYRDIIKAQFYGHTHFDEFKLYSDEQNKQKFVSIAYIGPSITSYRMFNPGVKMFETFGYVENFTSYVFDYQAKEWEPLYTSHDLGVKGNSDDMAKFVYRMANDEILFKQFFRYYNKGLEGQEEECDTLCRKRILCSLVRSNYQESEECNSIQKEVDGVVLPVKVLEEKKRRIWTK